MVKKTEDKPVKPHTSLTHKAFPVAPQAKITNNIPAIADSWPGPFGLYKYSKDAVMQNLATVVILYLLLLVFAIVFDILLKTPGKIIYFILGAFMTAASTLTYIAGVREKHISVNAALSEALPLWLKMIGLNILLIASVVIGIIVFIIPVFFILPRISLATYFLVDKKLSIIDSYQASWDATKGYSIRIWGIIGATLLMAIPIITLIGIPFSIYFLVMYSAVFAVVYEFILKSQPKKASLNNTSHS